MGYLKKHMPEDARAVHERIGWGKRMGFGERPGIVVIDMAYAWTDPKSDMGRDMSDAIENINRILAVARQAKPPIPRVFTVISYESKYEINPPTIKKTGNLRERYMIQGTRWTEIDARLNRQPDEILMVKKHSSCFMMTNLIEIFTFNRVDTVIITGCSTSGCVQATAYDCNALGYYCAVPEQAVSDRDPERGRFALFNIDAKYGDVVSVDETIDYLSKFKS
jgi:nicotinamidase-related amidase